MKCDICGGVAVIGMPQHRLNLCAKHFEWVPRIVECTIQRYAMCTRAERVLEDLCAFCRLWQNIEAHHD